MPAVPTNSVYSVSPWGERYHQTQRQKRGNFDGYPCAICGKDIPTAKANRHGGIITIDGDWTMDPDHPRSQGWHPVGSECHRRYVVRKGDAMA